MRLHQENNGKKTNYPITAPEVRFITMIEHPNVSPLNGYICLDILKHNWSPQFTFEKIILSIIVLLEEPNPASPLNLPIAQLYSVCASRLVALKKTNMSEAENTELFNTCFEEYIKKVNKYYVTNNVSKVIK